MRAILRSLYCLLLLTSFVDRLAYAEELQPIAIELPDPIFGGTPYDGPSNNLESVVIEPRAPFLAPASTILLSRGKPVSSSDPAPLKGALAQVTDGSKDPQDPSQVVLHSGLQWIQINLGSPASIQVILLWRTYRGTLYYFDTVVQISNDPAFLHDVTTIFNNDIDNSSGLGQGTGKYYFERYDGRLFDAKGTLGQYVRIYANGNCWGTTNHFTELEVFGNIDK